MKGKCVKKVYKFILYFLTFKRKYKRCFARQLNFISLQSKSANCQNEHFYIKASCFFAKIMNIAGWLLRFCKRRLLFIHLTHTAIFQTFTRIHLHVQINFLNFGSSLFKMMKNVPRDLSFFNQITNFTI